MYDVSTMENQITDFFGHDIVPIDETNLDQALYAVSGADIWPDYVDSVSAEQAIMCWRIVDKLLRERFLEELRQ